MTELEFRNVEATLKTAIEILPSRLSYEPVHENPKLVAESLCEAAFWLVENAPETLTCVDVPKLIDYLPRMFFGVRGKRVEVGLRL